LLTAKELFKLLSTTREDDIDYKLHFLKRLTDRAEICDIMPKDLTEFKKILLNNFPVYIDYQEDNELKNENEYKVFYNINEKYDIVVVLSLICSKPVKIKIITVYPFHVKRRLKLYEQKPEFP
jgi:hypothetical protein